MVVAASSEKHANTLVFTVTDCVVANNRCQWRDYEGDGDDDDDDDDDDSGIAPAA